MKIVSLYTQCLVSRKSWTISNISFWRC